MSARWLLFTPGDFMRVKQFQTWLVCQFCGAVTDSRKAKGWLYQPHRTRWDIMVIRCPQHWSEWALRHTREGRTKRNRERMAKALKMPVPQIPPYVGPFPVSERKR